MARKISRKGSRKGSRKPERAQYQKNVPEPETLVKHPMDELDSAFSPTPTNTEEHLSPQPLKTINEIEDTDKKYDEDKTVQDHINDHADEAEEEMLMGEIKDDQGEADQGEADQGEAEADVDVKEGEVKEEEPDVKVEGGNREEKEEKENEREEGELAEGGSVPEDEVHEVPEVKVPEVKLPDVERVREEGEVDEDEPEDGETKDDDHQLHEVQVAEVNAPEIDVTEVNVPEAEVPETEVQEVQALEAEVPEAKVPLVEDRGAESLHVEHVPSPAVSVETDLEEAKEFRSQKEVAETSLGSADDREEEMQETNGQEPTIKGPSSNPMAGVTFVARSPRKQKYEELGVPYETGTRTLTHDRPDEEEVKETVAEAKVHRKKCKYQPADDIRISKARAQDVQFIWRGGPKGRRIVHQDELLPETQASLEIAKQLHELLTAPKQAKKLLERFDDPDKLEEKEAIHVAKSYWTQDVEYRRRMFQQYRINTKGLEDRRGGVFPSAVFLVHQGRAHEDFEKSILEQRSQDAPWVWSSAPKATSNDRWAQWRLTNAINNQFYRMYHKYNTATFKIRR